MDDTIEKLKSLAADIAQDRHNQATYSRMIAAAVAHLGHRRTDTRLAAELAALSAQYIAQGKMREGELLADVTERLKDPGVPSAVRRPTDHIVDP